MDFPRIFERLCPGQNVSPVVGNGTYEQIVATWRGSGPPPSLAQCEATWATIEQEEAPLATRTQADAAEQAGCKSDPAIMNLINQTRAEWRTWAGGNFPSLTPAERTRLGDLFWVVAVGVRRLLRG